MSADDIRGVVVEGYTVRRRIGEGGFAAVFEATQDDIGAPVALKILTTGIGQAQSQRRLEREYRSMGRLRDLRGIVPVYGTAETAEGLPVIVMAYMAGGSLHDRLRGSGPMPVDEVLHVVDVLCDALQAAHDVGIHHRDIKPENVLLDRYGEPALSDFGLATIEGMRDASQTAASLSPPHAPPEKFLGTGVVDPVAADVYSLASTIHQLLNGRPPFGTSSDGGIAALILRITGEEAPTIDRDDVPTGLAEAIRTGLAKDPADRPKSPREFAEVVRSTPIEARPTPPLRPEPEDPIIDQVEAGQDVDRTRSISTRESPAPSEGTRVVTPPTPTRRRRKWLIAGASALVVAGLATAVWVGLRSPVSGLTRVGGRGLTYQTGTTYGAEPDVFLLRCGDVIASCGPISGNGGLVTGDSEPGLNAQPWTFRKLGAGCYAIYDFTAEGTNSDGRRVSNVVCL